MKSLTTLIRLQKREIDALRQEMAALEFKRDAFVDNINTLDQELVQEYEAADVLVEMRGFFGDFSDAIKSRRGALTEKLMEVERQIQSLSIDISNQYAELKKYDIAYERYLEELKRQEEDRERKELDEIGLRKFHYAET